MSKGSQCDIAGHPYQVTEALIESRLDPQRHGVAEVADLTIGGGAPIQYGHGNQEVIGVGVAMQQSGKRCQQNTVGRGAHLLCQRRDTFPGRTVHAGAAPLRLPRRRDG